jgi:hypothetical protein
VCLARRRLNVLWAMQRDNTSYQPELPRPLDNLIETHSDGWTSVSANRARSGNPPARKSLRRHGRGVGLTIWNRTNEKTAVAKILQQPEDFSSGQKE